MSLSSNRQLRHMARAETLVPATSPDAVKPMEDLTATEFASRCGIVVDPWQQRVLESDSNKQLLLCSRQSGKSTTACLAVLYQMAYYRGSLVLLASPSQRQSTELMRTVRRLYQSADTPLPTVEAESALSFELTNGSRCVALPGTESSARGYAGVDLIVVDEASRVDDDLLTAIRPVLATKSGRTLALTTPGGARGWFYDQWHGGSDLWERTQVSVHECPRISPEFLEEEKRVIGPLKFRQEYLLEWVADGSGTFSPDSIRRCFRDTVEPLWTIHPLTGLPA